MSKNNATLTHESEWRHKRAPSAGVCVLLLGLVGCDSSALYLGNDVTDAGKLFDARSPRADAARPGGDAAANALDAGRGDAANVPDRDADASGDAMRSDDDAGVACPTGFADCNGDTRDGCEVDVQADPLHCGACGITCPIRTVDAFGARCIAGHCAFNCENGMADCDGNLANGCETFTRSDPTNCGACGMVCARCNRGVCTN